MKTIDLAEEIRKTKRLADMQATAHNIECERYRRWFWTFTWTGVLLAITFVTVAFVPRDVAASALGIPIAVYGAIAGAASVTALVLSLIPLITRPLEQSAAHAQAVHHFVHVKQQCTRFLKTGRCGEKAYLKVRTMYEDSAALPKISERRFLKLKRAHLQKVEKSKRLDHAT